MENAQRMVRRMLLASVVVSMGFVAGGCRKIEYSGTWAEQPSAIDGKGDEWATSKAYLAEHNVAFAANNDSSFLYLYLSTRDPALQRQICQGGLTVWLDDNARSDSAYGLRFPATSGSGVRSAPYRGRGEHGFLSAEKIEELNRSMELLGPEKKRRRHALVLQAREFGIDAALGIQNREVTIELKLPLAPTAENVHALCSNGEGIVCLRLETTLPKISSSGPPGGGKGGGMRGGPGGGGKRGGGMGGGGSMHGGDRSSERGGMGSSALLEPIKLSLEIALATSPDARTHEDETEND